MLKVLRLKTIKSHKIDNQDYILFVNKTAFLPVSIGRMGK